MVPLAVKEVRETSSTDVHELVEDCGDDSLVFNLKVDAGLAR